GVLAGAAMATLGDLIARLPALDPRGPEYARAIEVLLHHAGRRLSIIADPGGAIRAAASTPIAAQVLGLPLFPGPGGLPISAWTVLQALGDRLRRHPERPLGGVDLVDAAALDQTLRTWLLQHVHSGRVIREPTRARLAPAPAQPAA